MSSGLDEYKRQAAYENFLGTSNVEDRRAFNNDFRKLVEYSVLGPGAKGAKWFPDVDFMGWTGYIEKDGMRHIIFLRANSQHHYIDIRSISLNQDLSPVDANDPDSWGFGALYRGDLNTYVQNHMVGIRRENVRRTNQGFGPAVGTEDWEKIAAQYAQAPRVPINPSFQDRLDQSQAARQAMVDKAKEASETR